MRRAVLGLVILLVSAAIVADCGVRPFLGFKHTFEQSPLRQFGEFGSPSPGATDFSPIFKKRLKGKIMPAVTTVQVSGAIDFNKVLGMMGGSPQNGDGVRKYPGAWRIYLGRLGLLTLDTSLSGSPPHPLRALEMDEGQSAESVCQGNQPVSASWTVQYCRANVSHRKGDQIGLMVLPVGYTEKFQLLADKFGGQWQQVWLAASIVAAVVYAQHLRNEISDPANGAGYNWPSLGHLQFDYCVAGISVRAVFPPKYAEEASVIVRELSGKLGLSIQNLDQDAAALYDGMTTGNLRSCLS